MMPKRLSFLSDYICSKLSENKGGAIPPLLLRGPTGSGKGWVLSQIVTQLNKSERFIPIVVPYMLNASHLVSRVSQTVANKEKELKQKKGDAKKRDSGYSYVILMEGIDVLFNVNRDFRSQKKVFGKSAEYSQQIQHASELRSYLLENSRKVSIIASSSENTQFIEDPDLPFYNFFNLIEVNPLNEIESIEYINEKIGKHKQAMEIVSELDKKNPHWPTHLTEGLISNVNLFVGTALEVVVVNNTNNKLKQFLIQYFNKLDPLLEKIVDGMSYSEKGLVDHLCSLPMTFDKRQIRHTGTNLSRSISTLVNKQILTPSPNRENSFQFKSPVFRSWLRFNKQLEIFDGSKDTYY